MDLFWTVILGFGAGVIAKLILPGKNEPSGFIATTIVGIVGAYVSSFLGQFLGFYRAGEAAGFIGSIIGAILLLIIYGRFFQRKVGT
jgi:uncharacterized membrane protein YeaQ/YmgE (transglycosylase-associated protein family)